MSNTKVRILPKMQTKTRLLFLIAQAYKTSYKVTT